MKKTLLILAFFILTTNSFADEYDNYAATEKKPIAKSKKSDFQVGIGFDVLSGTKYAWRATVLLEDNIALYLLSNFNRHETENNNVTYDFSLGLGASFTLHNSPLPIYAGASAKYIHPTTNENGVGINLFGGLKATFLNAFEVAGELGIYFEQVSTDAGTRSEIGLKPAIYLTWFFG